VRPSAAQDAAIALNSGVSLDRAAPGEARRGNGSA
jgi:hypothetical protein